MKTRVLLSLFALLVSVATVSAQTTTTYATNDLPANVLLADVDNDGDLDVATFGTGSQNVSVRLNNGDGTYGTAAEYGVGSGLHVKGGAFGDINGDGFVDLVVTNNLLANNVTPILNDGDGTFTVGTSFAATASFYPDFVGLADLDGDGDLDLMLSSQFTYINAGNYVAGRMLNNGSGVFGGLTLWQVGTQPVSMLAFDMDGDGDRDIATANANSDNITLAVNGGTGSFSTFRTLSSDLDSPRRMAAVDFDEDGDLDLFVANHDDSNVLMFRNDETTSGTTAPFFFFPNITSTGANSFPQYVAFDDLNSDGNQDLIVSGANIYTFNGNGSGGMGSMSTINVGHSPSGFATGDIRGLGATDYAAADLANDLLTIYLSPVAPVVTTTAATSLTSSGATLNGTVNARGSSTTTEFDYKLASAGTYSNTVTATPSPVTGSTVTDISYALTGLLPNTEYDFRASGTNTAGEVLGTELSFTTSAAAPLVTTGAASNVSVTTATLNGTVNAKNATATAYFEYGTSAGVYTTQVNVSGTINDGMDAVDVSAGLTGLAANTTYYYRLVSSNAGGTTNGSEGSFSTSAPIMLISSTSPAANAVSVSSSSDITITFNEAVKATTVNSTSIQIIGSFNGTYAASYSAVGTTATINPTDNFLPGEVITVYLSTAIQSDAYSEPLEANHTFSFVVGTEEVADIAFGLANYATGDGPHEIAAGDLNGDGFLDLVSVNQGSPNLSVNLSNGNGTFAAATIYATGTFPQGVKLGDFDDNGTLDIAVTHITPSGLGVFMNLGTGTFGVMTSINTTAAHDIEVLDVDVDGDLDIVQTGTGVTVVLGDGNGNFGTGTAYGSGTTYYIAKGDLNDDGRIDLVTTDYGGNVIRVFLSNGVGTFAEPTAYGAGTNPNGIKIGDMDADGDLDIVVANYNSGGTGSVGVYLNNGNGTMAAAATYEVTGGPYDVDVSDLNGDGSLDVAVSQQVGDGFTAFTNNGTGTLVSPEFFSGGNNARGIVAADFNGDGKIDVATANNFGNNISVHKTTIPAPTVVSVSPDLNAMDVSKTSNITVTFATPMKASTLTASNIIVTGSVGGVYSGSISGSTATSFTFDPADDFQAGELVQVVLTNGLQNLEGTAMAKPYTYTFTVGSTSGDGPFKADGSLSIDWDNVVRTEHADLDADGDIDVVAFVSWYALVRLNNGDGTYANAQAYNIGSNNVSDGILVDIDKDGDLDVVSAHLDMGRIGILRNNGSGVFSDPKAITATGASSITSVDVNNDGYADAVVANTNANTITVYLHNQYTNQFISFNSPGTDYAAGTTPSSIASGDLNGDGHADVVVTNSGSGNVSVLMNNTNGTLAAVVNYTVGTAPSEAALADVNGDGHLDLLVSNSGSDNVSVLLNSGTGTFGTAVNYAAGDAPSAITASDIDGDGSVDLIVANQDSDNISILTNNEDGTFGTANSYAAGDGPIDIHAIDKNGDGDLDLYTYNVTSENITYLSRIAGPSVVSVTPTANSLAVDAAANITVTFDEAMNAGSLTSSSIAVRGALGGRYEGVVSYDANVATFNPASDFLPGDQITITVTAAVQNAANENLEYPYAWSFTTESALGGFSYVKSNYGDLNSDAAGLTAADIDLDGDLDFITTQYDDGLVSVLLNDGTGGVASKVDYNVGSGPFSVKAVDYNGDGYLDISVANSSSNNVSILLNDTEGAFGSVSNYAVGSNPSDHEVFDADGDGDLDIVTNNRGSSTVSVLRNQGTGVFTTQETVNLGFAAISYATMRLADIDLDGALDVILVRGDMDYGTYQNVTKVRILPNLGDGRFDAPVSYDYSSIRAADFEVGDYNGDGKPDLALLDDGTNAIRFLINNGDGTYPASESSSVTLDPSRNPQTMKSADLDGDGDVDLVIANNGHTAVTFFSNNGSGTFSSAAETNATSTSYVSRPILIADFGGDGKLDVAIGFSYGIDFFGPMPAPTTSASNISINNDVGTRMYMNWTNGNGHGRIVFMKQGSAVDYVPVDNTTYNANSSFGQGTQYGSGNYVVFSGNQSWQNVAYLYNLELGTEYHLAIYEYNQDGSAIRYRLTSPARASHTTATSPSEQAGFGEVLTDYGRQLTAQFTPGNGNARIVLMKEGAPVDATPTDNTTYAANTEFGLGAQIGTGNYVIFNGTQPFPDITVTGVTEGTTYHFAVFEYNGDPGDEAYNTDPGNTASHTTNAEAGFPFDEVAGHAVRFTGQSAEYPYATLSDQVVLGDVFSTEMWVKTDSIGTAMTFFSIGGYLDMLSLGLNATGQFTASVADTITASKVTVTGTTTAVKNGLYHLGLTAESDGLVRLYINGTQEASAAINELLMEGEDGYLTLGAKAELYSSNEEDPGTPDSEHFVGVIDELRFWSRVRTATEIRNERRTVPVEFPEDLVGYWQFNDEEEVEYSYDMYHIQSDFSYVEFVKSPAPFGGIASVSSAVTTGNVTLGGLQLTLTEAFDNPVEVHLSEITGDPNRFPAGYSSSTGDKLFLVELFGDPGAFEADLTLTFGSGVVTAEQETTPSLLKLFKRGSNDAGTWTDLGGASSAVAATGVATWTGLTSFSQFVVVSDANLAPPVTLWRIDDGYVNVYKENYANFSLEANQDRITDNVWLTRKNNRGLFNIVTEEYYDDDNNTSPEGTQWAYGTIDDLENLTFDNWYNAIYDDFGADYLYDIVGETFVMYIEEENLYVEVKFTGWTQGSNGGGFSYVRGSGEETVPVDFDQTAGNALAFDGQNDYMTFELDDILPRFPMDITFEMWVKPAALPTVGDDMVFASGNQDNHKIGFDSDGKFFAEFYDDDYRRILGTTVAEVGKWYHIAATVDGNDSLKLYVNGVQEASIAFGETYESLDDFVYGRADYYSDSYFEGQLDEIRIWTVARTQSEIRANMFNANSGASGLNAFAVWQLNEGTGTTVTDAIYGREIDLTYAEGGEPSWVTSTIPIGGVSGVASGVQSGTADVGGATLTFNTPFENPVDVFFNEITTDPNVFPVGFTSSIGGKYFVIDLVGDPGTFSLDLTLTFGAGVVTEAQESSPSILKLFRRSSGSTGAWTELTGATEAISATGEVTWAGITSFSEFIVVESEPTDIFTMESADVTVFSGSTYAFSDDFFDIDPFFGDSTFALTANLATVGPLFVDVNDDGDYDAGIDDILTDASGATYTPSELEGRLRYTPSSKGIETVIVTFTSGDVSSDVAIRFITVDAHPSLAGVSGENGWYLLANPLNTSLGTLFENIWTQGAPNSDAPGGQATLFTFNQTLGSYQAITTDLDTTKLSAGTGILAYVYAFNNPTDGVPVGGGWPKQLTNEGNPFGLAASITVRNVDADDDEFTSGSEGFALLGNPFGWSLSADSVIATLKRADPLANSYVYRWNPVSKRYQLLTGGAINAYESVFVRLISSDIERTIQFDYNDGLNLTPAVKSVEDESIMVPFTLTSTNHALTSEMHVRIGKEGAAGIDPFDGYYLGSYASRFANLYMGSGDQGLVINNLPEALDREVSIPIHLHATVSGEFELSWSTEMLPSGWSFVLEETSTGTRVNLGQATSHRFTSERLSKSSSSLHGSVPETQGQDPMFILHIVPANVTSLEDGEVMPTEVELAQNYPNPFNPSTMIRYAVPSQSAVTLEVFDILGRQVATLVNNQVMPAGRHSVSFDAGRLASGVYVYRLVVGEKVMTKRMVLIK